MIFHLSYLKFLEQLKWKDMVDISTNMVNPRIGKYNQLSHIEPGNIESFTGQFYNNMKKDDFHHLITILQI